MHKHIEAYPKEKCSKKWLGNHGIAVLNHTQSKLETFIGHIIGWDC